MQVLDISAKGLVLLGIYLVLLLEYLVLLPKQFASLDMSKQSKLELEFEILTLTNNIETLKKLGKHTGELKQRLDICREQFVQLNLSSEHSSYSSPKTENRDAGLSFPDSSTEGEKANESRTGFQDNEGDKASNVLDGRTG